jgi:hypothetical protein
VPYTFLAVTEPKVTQAQIDSLNPRQRRLAEILAADTGIENWKAAWLAGYYDLDPEAEPEDTAIRKKLSKATTQALTSEKVVAYIEHLRQLGAAAALTAPEARDMRDRIREARVVGWETEKVVAMTYDLMVRKAHFDPADVMTCDGESASVIPFDEMDVAQRQMIHSVDYQAACPECGIGREGVKITFEARATYVDKLLKFSGAYAPNKLEVAGKDGGPIQVHAEVGLSWATIEAVRHAIIGRPVPLADSEG